MNNNPQGARKMDPLTKNVPHHLLKENKNPLILKSIDNPSLISQNMTNSPAYASLSNNMHSLNIHSDATELPSDSPSFLLLDNHERLSVHKPEDFLRHLKIKNGLEKIKVVSIFGNTGEGKSHTLNQIFFKGAEAFQTSPEQRSCTLGVWAAYDPNLKVICLDTEGLLGVTAKEGQRTRLLLKVLAVSDVVIYRTRAERLQKDMFVFLGSASKAYRDHFQSALQDAWRKCESEPAPASLGPGVIIFHETKHTNTLRFSASVTESPEDILRARFGELKLECDAFSSLKYIGTQSRQQETDFSELRNAVQLELENTGVRSKRNPTVIFHTLKGLNEKFSGEIKNTPPKLYLREYFTCQVKCQSCNEGCTLSMGHKQDAEAHKNSSKCKFQHQYQNCVYLCKQCSKNGERIIVKPSYQSITEKSWSNLFSYVWSGYVIECRNCGEIYRSRQHWFGNKSPEDSAVITEYVHVWPGEKNFIGSNNSIQKVLDGVTYISDVVATVGSQPTKAVKTFITESINPSYWRPDREIIACYKCQTVFPANAKKHHCRACGEGFCEKCSSKTQPVPSRGWREEVRVCDDCYQETPPSLSHSVENTEVTIRKIGETVINSLSAVASALEIPKDMIKDSARPSYWTPDSECLNCVCCDNPFGPVIPLHHCRQCGKGVCDDCSTAKKVVEWRGWDYPVRVCNHCTCV